MQNWSRYISQCLVTKAGTTPDISSRGFNTENCLQNFWKGKRSRMKIFAETPTNMFVTLSLESCSWSPQSPPHDAAAATRGTTKAGKKKAFSSLCNLLPVLSIGSILLETHLEGGMGRLLCILSASIQRGTKKHWREAKRQETSNWNTR